MALAWCEAKGLYVFHRPAFDHPDLFDPAIHRKRHGQANFGSSSDVIWIYDECEDAMRYSVSRNIHCGRRCATVLEQLVNIRLDSQELLVHGWRKVDNCLPATENAQA